MAVLFKKNMGLIESIFADLEGRLVVVDVTCSSGQALRLLDVYAPCNAWKSDFFRRLEIFHEIPRTLVVLGDFNRILNTRVDCVGSNPKRVRNPYLGDLFSKFQLADRFTLNYPNVLQWSWVNNDALSRSYPHRLFVRTRDKDRVSCSV